jgi:hypothetical protein
MAQNRYLPIGYHFWYLYYGEWDHNPSLSYEFMPRQPRYSDYDITFHQRVCDVPIWLDACVTEMGPSCMNIIRSRLEPPSFTRGCYRCGKPLSSISRPWPLRSSPGGANAKVRLLRQRPLRTNHCVIQNICRHKEESDYHLMLLRNNDIATYFWPMRDWLCSNEGM